LVELESGATVEFSLDEVSVKGEPSPRVEKKD